MVVDEIVMGKSNHFEMPKVGSNGPIVPSSADELLPIPLVVGSQDVILITVM